MLDTTLNYSYVIHILNIFRLSVRDEDLKIETTSRECSTEVGKSLYHRGEKYASNAKDEEETRFARDRFSLPTGGDSGGSDRSRADGGKKIWKGVGWRAGGPGCQLTS